MQARRITLEAEQLDRRDRLVNAVHVQLESGQRFD